VGAGAGYEDLEQPGDKERQHFHFLRQACFTTRHVCRTSDESTDNEKIRERATLQKCVAEVTMASNAGAWQEQQCHQQLSVEAGLMHDAYEAIMGQACTET
jgi:hypothetical protein